MEPQAYCRDKAAPTGSSTYYAALFAPPAIRDGLIALAALRREILEIPHEVSESAVGEAKLGWWHEELQRLANDMPRHPITQALAPYIQAHALPVATLEDTVEAARMDLTYSAYPTLRELTVYCHRAGGGVADLARRMTGAETPAAAAFAHDLSMGLELTRMIRHLRRDLRAGRLYIPEDELHLSGLTLETIAETDADADQVARRVDLLRRQARRARQFLDSAIGHLPATERPAQSYGLTLAVLYRELLNTLDAADFPVLERQHHLTPLRKLWLAWRIRRAPQRLSPRSPENPS